MNDNRSVATIDGPEFIDIKPYNPLISECQIKVFYLGRNRNGSFIDKNTAIQMANSLPGCPIVGYWKDDKQDFGDHGHVITIEDNEIKFAVKTVPYGFVAPDARVWFQKFIDTDEFGEEVEREYVMTTGYLWTGQFEEAQSVIEEGKGQSMELDESSLNGHWANDNKTGMDFFIINDAVFSKLCILGNDVEPCFEGASITDKEVQYTKDTDFTHSLYVMMKQLQEILEQGKGGLNMPTEDFVATTGDQEIQEQSEVAEEMEQQVEAEIEEHEDVEDAAENDSDVADESDNEDVDAEDTEDSGADTEDDADSDFVKKEEEPQQDESDAGTDAEPAEEDEDKKKQQTAENACGNKKKYTLDEDEFAAIKAELDSLRSFKLAIENKEKDALIAKYHMLSDEDKADIVAHKEEYTLEQIEEKLALVYVKNNVDFSTVDGHKEMEREEMDSLLSFSLDDSSKKAEVVSDIQAAFRELEL